VADHRIIAIDLDDRSILRRSDEIEQERQVAMLDLLAGNSFLPLRAAARGHPGPWRLHLAVQDGRLAITIADPAGTELERLLLGLARFRRPIRDYFAICESYYRARREGAAARLETVDMARRGIHNEAAELLRDCLAGKAELDFDTARRLFTLVCVLHIRR
jgi:uncharacterized protein (UPF0262 family)